MKMLYLGSTSASRKMLLTSAGIPFTCLPIDADESQCDWTLPLCSLVSTIASYKMTQVQLPSGQEGQIIHVLTADTLSQDNTGTISGKPASRDDARRMIRAARSGMITCTGFCVEKKQYQEGRWHTIDRTLQTVQAQYVFDVPESWLEWYLLNSAGLGCSGAIAIEDHGGLFLQEVQGSYTTIVGLPLFQVRGALEAMDFFTTTCNEYKEIK